jgi:ribosome-binding protein aMBF1 (putative translation factor)
LTYYLEAAKKWSKEKLATRLEEGANIIKAVYRYSALFFLGVVVR